MAGPLDLYVRRAPPSAGHFLSQRVRQAYDDFALPLRMSVLLLVAPAALIALARGSVRTFAVGAAATIALAEAGRRRAGGRRYFPASSSLLAPLWVAERSVSVWLALATRLLRGGVRYGDGIIRRSANSSRSLRRRLYPTLIADRSGRPEADQLVGPVAERVDAGAPAATERDSAPA